MMDAGRHPGIQGPHLRRGRRRSRARWARFARASGGAPHRRRSRALHRLRRLRRRSARSPRPIRSTSGWARARRSTAPSRKPCPPPTRSTPMLCLNRRAAGSLCERCRRGLHARRDRSGQHHARARARGRRGDRRDRLRRVRSDAAAQLRLRRAIPNVVTSLELERLLNASGPTRGHVVRPSDAQAPRSLDLRAVRRLARRGRSPLLLALLLHERGQGRAAAEAARPGSRVGHDPLHRPPRLRQGLRGALRPGAGDGLDPLRARPPGARRGACG